MAQENRLAFEGTSELTVKEYLEVVKTLRTLRMREILLIALLILYTFLVFSTTAIFFLQGFRVGGFHLDSSLLVWLGGVTIGEVAGLIALTISHYLRAD